jgi:hypothetical protein
MAKGDDSTGGGGRLLILAVLLALLVGAGVWNYRRNVALEEHRVGPYRTLSDGDLATLLAASESEAAAVDAAYQRSKGARPAASAGSDRFGAFERAHQRGREARELGQRASELEAMAAEVRKEIEYRAGRGDEMDVLLRRVLVLSF